MDKFKKLPTGAKIGIGFVAFVIVMGTIFGVPGQ